MPKSFRFILLITTLLLAAVLFSPGIVQNIPTTEALGPGDVSVRLITGNDGAGIQELVSDSNNCPAEGPRAAYVGVEITNTSGGTLTGLTATLTNLDTANGFDFAGGQVASQNIGTLSAGESINVYWFIQYPCHTAAVNTDSIDVVVADSNPGTVSTNFTLASTSSISANAGGLINSSTLGPGAVVGQLITMDVVYSFGNVQAGDDFYWQPAGSPTFNAGCLQLVGSEVLTSDLAAIAVGETDMYEQAAASQGGSNNILTVQYTFLYVCDGVASTANPYAAQTSGAVGLKYTGNYDDSPPPEITFPPAVNPFTISKTANPTSLTPPGGVVTYTITINNTDPTGQNIDSYITSIFDTLPTTPGVVTYVGLTGASDVTAANSSNVPLAGATGNIQWDSRFTNTSRHYLVPANGSISVVYDVNVPGDVGTYTNSATASIGSTTIGPATTDVVVASQADLSITKTDSPDPVVAGNNLTYTIQVDNAGPSAATNVVVTDTLPAGVTFVSTSGCAEDPNGVPTCTLGNIAPGGSASYTVTVTVDSDTPAGTITNNVSVTSNQVDPTPGNNSTSEDTTVITEADLSITKTDSPDPVVAGLSILTYTVQVDNAGPSDATNVVVTDTLPAGVTFVSTTGCTEDPNGVPTCTLGNIAAGGSASYTITVTVDSSTTGTITNNVSVAADQTDPVPGNNSTSEDTTVNTEADLSITKTDNPDPVLAGNNLTYIIQVANAGPSDATNVVVTDTLPAGVTFVSTTGCAEDPNGVPTCSLGTIAAGGSAFYTVNVTVDSDTPAGTITNTAVVTSDVPDPDSADNSTIENTTVITEADLSITKSDSPDPVIAGNNLTYTIQVDNAGPSDATNVVVTDTLPAGVTFVSTTGCAEDPNGVPTCSLGTIAAGGSASFTVTVTVDLATTGTITNTVSVTADQTDPTPGNNSTSEDTTVTNTQADLSITKTDSVDPVVAGNTLTYTIQVDNAGPADATNVVVTDTLPAGVTFVSTTGCAEDPNGVPTCSLGTITAGNSASYDVTVTVDSSTTGTITNNVSVTSDQPDPTPGNNSTSEDTTVNTEADLSITKTDSPDPVVAGNNLTYTIQVDNAGPSDAANVVVTEALPAEVTFVSTSGCAEDPNGVPTCTLGTIAAGGSASYTVTVTVNSDTPAGTITNDVSVSSDTTDPNSANDRTTEDTTVNTEADLSITKTDSPDPVIAGNNLTYTIQVDNAGPSDATNVVVTDTLPAGVTFVSTTGCAEDPNGVPTCSLGTIAAGGSASFTVTVTVDLATTGTITNNVSVTADQTDPIPGNNSTSEDTTVTNTQADLSITKTDSVDPVVAGNTLTYTIQVDNAGPADATNVVVTEALPAGVTFVSTSGCAEDPNGVPTCSLGTITVGGSASYTVTVTVDSSTTTTLTNTVTVAADQADPNTADNTATETTGIDVEADLSIVKTDSPDPVLAGGTLTYTIQVTNNGPSDAVFVSVDDTLPAGVTFVSTVGCTNDPNGVPFCDLGTIPAGTSVSYTITVTVDPGTSGTITNTAEVVAETFDPVPGNNVDSEDTTIAASDLSVTKSDSPDPVLEGANLTYTIVVTNNGPGDASNAAWSDPLAAGQTFVSLTQPGGWTCSDPGVGNNGAVSCNIASLAPGTYNFTLVVSVPVGTSASSPISNTVTVSADNDTNSQNDTDTEDTVVVPPQVAADMGVTKTDDVDPVTPGNNLTYTVDVVNNGPDPATNASWTDTLPAGLTFVSLTQPGGWTCSDPGVGNNGVVSCNIASMPVGTQSFTLVVNVPAGYGGSNPIVNNVSTTADEPDLNQANDSDSESTDVLIPGVTPVPIILVFDPAISKVGILEDGGLGLPGEVITWAVTVTNIGNGTGTDIVITDNIRPELQVLNATTKRGTSTVSGQNVTFNIPYLDPGESIQMTIETLVLQSPFDGQFENLANLTGVGPNGVVTRSASAIVFVPSTLPATGYRPVDETADVEDKSLPLLPIAGGILLLIGGAVVTVRRYKR